MFPMSSDPPEKKIPEPRASWTEGTASGGPQMPSWMAPANDDGSVPPPPSRRSEVSLSPSAIPELRPPTLPPPIRDYEAEITALREQIAACVMTIEGLRRSVLEASERDVVQLALVVAERIVGQSIETNPSLVVGWIRTGIASLINEDRINVVVSPDIAATIEETAIAAAEDDREIHVTIGHELPPASCEIRGQLGQVDASLKARLHAMADALGVADPTGDALDA